MKPLFSPGIDSLLRWGLSTIIIGSFVGLCGLLEFNRGNLITGEHALIQQPIQFDHRHHVRDDGIDCRYCHCSVDRTASAGIPSPDVCLACHAQVWNREAITEPLRRSLDTAMPIHWKPVHALPDFVYFNHAAHVSRGVGCSSCHGQVGKMALVMQVQPLTMGWCLDCHRNPAPYLRPQSEIVNEEWDPPAAQRLAIGTDLARRLAIAPPLNCTGCHR